MGLRQFLKLWENIFESRFKNKTLEPICLSKLMFIVYNRFFLFEINIVPNESESIYCSKILIAEKYFPIIINCFRKNVV
jgi:hypothetical protein